MGPDELGIPDDFADSVDGGFIDLPFEGADADPQPLEYADLPNVNFDPDQNWREAQAGAARRMTGEFGPEDQEATDG